MTIESATYISDLNTSYPENTSQKKDGDDHIRLIKATIKTTLPNITGIMSASHTELSYSVGVTSAIQTQINTKGAHAGQAWTGAQDFTGATITMATQAAGNNTTRGATTEFVTAAVFGASVTMPGQTDKDGLVLTSISGAANWYEGVDQSRMALGII